MLNEFNVLEKELFYRLAQTYGFASAIHEIEIAEIIRAIMGSMYCHNERTLMEHTKEFAKKEIYPQMEFDKKLEETIKNLQL